ncbi:hypothetical protein ACLOJK_019164 [Asimina triloba]
MSKGEDDKSSSNDEMMIEVKKKNQTVLMQNYGPRNVVSHDRTHVAHPLEPASLFLVTQNSWSPIANAANFAPRQRQLGTKAQPLRCSWVRGEAEVEAIFELLHLSIVGEGEGRDEAFNSCYSSPAMERAESNRQMTIKWAQELEVEVQGNPSCNRVEVAEAKAFQAVQQVVELQESSRMVEATTEERIMQAQAIATKVAARVETLEVEL